MWLLISESLSQYFSGWLEISQNIPTLASFTEIERLLPCAARDVFAPPDFHWTTKSLIICFKYFYPDIIGTGLLLELAEYENFLMAICYR